MPDFIMNWFTNNKGKTNLSVSVTVPPLSIFQGYRFSQLYELLRSKFLFKKTTNGIALVLFTLFGIKLITLTF